MDIGCRDRGRARVIARERYMVDPHAVAPFRRCLVLSDSSCNRKDAGGCTVTSRTMPGACWNHTCSQAQATYNMPVLGPVRAPGASNVLLPSTILNHTGIKDDCITGRGTNREREDHDDGDVREEERHPLAPQL